MPPLQRGAPDLTVRSRIAFHEMHKTIIALGSLLAIVLAVYVGIHLGSIDLKNGAELAGTLDERIRLLNQKAEKYYSTSRYGEAISVVDELIVLDPKNPKHHYNRGNANLENGDADAAIDDFTKVISLNGDESNVYIARGSAYQDLKDNESCLRDLSRAIALDPNNAKAFSNRGTVHATMKNYDLALRDFERAIAVDSSNLLVYLTRAGVREYTGDKQGALEDYRTIVGRFKASGEAGRYQLYYEEAKKRLAEVEATGVEAEE